MPEITEPKTSPAVNIAGGIASVAAMIAGRFLGWAFGLQFVLPLVAGLVTTSLVKKKAPQNPYAAALGVHAAAVTFSLLNLVISSIRFGPHFGPIMFLMLAVSIGGFVWLIVQPGPQAAGLLIARHGYTLVMSLIGLARMVGNAPLTSLIDSGLTIALSATALALLVRTLLAQRAASPAVTA